MLTKRASKPDQQVPSSSNCLALMNKKHNSYNATITNTTTTTHLEKKGLHKNWFLKMFVLQAYGLSIIQVHLKIYTKSDCPDF